MNKYLNTRDIYGGNNMVILEVQKAKKLDDGQHYGMIKEINNRTEPYAYTDVIIELEDKMTITAGYPTMLMKESKLGALLARFGAILSEGESIDLDDWLPLRAVSFITMTDKGGYAKVISESLKPDTRKDTPPPEHLG